MSNTIIMLVFTLALCLATGLLMTRFLSKINLPNVTAYLVAGVILSPFTFGIMKEQYLNSLDFISTLALGFIAFSIGFCFKINHLKKLGSKIYKITFFESVFTAIVVDVILLISHIIAPTVVPLAEVFVLGAIATATAPAATLLVVKQYKAKGPVTDTLLPVVAIDDAVGLIVFAVSLSVSQAIATGESMTVKAMLLEPLLEIFLSLLIGAGLGLILSLACKFFKSRANRLTLIITSIFCGIALSELLNLSGLLLCMMIGAIYCNLSKETEGVMEVYDRWTHPLYVIFFVLAGASLNVKMILSVGIIGFIYIISRSIGKYTGARIGSTLGRCEPNVKKYLGLTLLPQAGVALGMSQVVANSLPPEYGNSITTIVLCATLIYELVGPLITKLALTKAGEIKPSLKKLKIPPTPPTPPNEPKNELQQ